MIGNNSLVFSGLFTASCPDVGEPLRSVTATRLLSLVLDLLVELFWEKVLAFISAAVSLFLESACPKSLLSESIASKSLSLLSNKNVVIAFAIFSLPYNKKLINIS